MKDMEFDAGDFGLVSYTTQFLDEEGFEELFYEERDSLNVSVRYLAAHKRCQTSDSGSCCGD